MKRREFIKNTGLGAGSILTTSSIATILAACNKNNMMNGSGMNMGGQPIPVTEGNFSRLLPIPNTVDANAALTAQSTSANINGNNISVLGYQANGIFCSIIRINSGINSNICFQNNLSEKTNIHWHGLKIPAN